jgi:hypothetical protein
MTSLRVVRRLGVVAAVLGALLGVAVAPAGAVSDPQTWGDTFCTETVTWLTGALQGAQNVQTKASDPSLTPADGKQLLVDYLQTGVASTKSFGQQVKAAGVPDIANGAKIQAALLAGIAGSGAKLATYEKAAKALPTKPAAAFGKGASKLGNRLKTFAQPFQNGLAAADKLDKGNVLGGILETRPACAPLVKGTIGTGS